MERDNTESFEEYLTSGASGPDDNFNTVTESKTSPNTVSDSNDKQIPRDADSSVSFPDNHSSPTAAEHTDVNNTSRNVSKFRDSLFAESVEELTRWNSRSSIEVPTTAITQTTIEELVATGFAEPSEQLITVNPQPAIVSDPLISQLQTQPDGNLAPEIGSNQPQPATVLPPENGAATEFASHSSSTANTGWMAIPSQPLGQSTNLAFAATANSSSADTSSNINATDGQPNESTPQHQLLMDTKASPYSVEPSAQTTDAPNPQQPLQQVPQASQKTVQSKNSDDASHQDGTQETPKNGVEKTAVHSGPQTKQISPPLDINGNTPEARNHPATPDDSNIQSTNQTFPGNSSGDLSSADTNKDNTPFAPELKQLGNPSNRQVDTSTIIDSEPDIQSPRQQDNESVEGQSAPERSANGEPNETQAINDDPLADLDSPVSKPMNGIVEKTTTHSASVLAPRTRDKSTIDLAKDDEMVLDTDSSESIQVDADAAVEGPAQEQADQFPTSEVKNQFSASQRHSHDSNQFFDTTIETPVAAETPTTFNHGTDAPRVSGPSANFNTIKTESIVLDKIDRSTITSIIQQTTNTVAQQVQNLNDRKSQSIQIQIHPAELGQLEIRVESTDEMIRTHIVASEFATTELLNRDKTQLVTALQDIGIELTDLEISHRQDSFLSDQDDRNHLFQPSSNQDSRSSESAPLSEKNNSSSDPIDNNSQINVIA